MINRDISTVLERIEGVTAEVLEDLIARVEDEHHIKVLEVDVDVVQGAGNEAPSVNVSIEIEQPTISPQYQPM